MPRTMAEFTRHNCALTNVCVCVLCRVTEAAAVRRPYVALSAREALKLSVLRCVCV